MHADPSQTIDTCTGTGTGTDDAVQALATEMCRVGRSLYERGYVHVASMSGEYDSLWLQQGETGGAHIFERNGKQLEIFQALDSAQPDEMPQFYPGKREWVLQKQ